MADNDPFGTEADAMTVEMAPDAVITQNKSVSYPPQHISCLCSQNVLCGRTTKRKIKKRPLLKPLRCVDQLL